MHATVVFVPLTAFVLGLSVVSRRFRDWAGPLPLGLALLSVALVPLTTGTGENLEHTVGDTRLVQQHAELAGWLIWWCLGMLVVAAASYFLRRRTRRLSRGVATALLVAGVVLPLGTLVQVALIGHSGAEAAWHGTTGGGVAAAQPGGDD